MPGMVLLMAISLADATAALPMAEPTPRWRGLVVVLVPPIDDDVMRNALARVSGELAAAPFKTVRAPIDPEGDVMSQVETAGTDQAATAAFAIVRDRDPGSGRVTIWVSNRVSGTTTMQRMQVEGGNVDRAAARLAVETVELVRASLAELWPAPAPQPIAPPVIVEQPPAERPGRLAIAVGAGLLTDLGDAPDFWAPQIAVSYGRPAGFAVRLSASGLGPGAGVSSATGSARIERSMATLGVVRSFRPDARVQPLVGVAAGVQYLSAHGTIATERQTAHDRSAASALGMVSAGLAIALSARIAVAAEVDAFMITPSVTVQVPDGPVATFDRPALFTHVGLRATF